MIGYREGKFYADGSTRAQPEEIWKVLTDTTLWPLWGLSISTVKCEERFIRSGSQGRVQTAVGIWLPFTVTSYEEMQFWSWEVSGIRATGHKLVTKDDGSCRIIFDMPWWAAPYTLVCLLAIRRIINLAEQK